MTLMTDRDGWIAAEKAQVGDTLSAGQAMYGFTSSAARDVVVNLSAEDREPVIMEQSSVVTAGAAQDGVWTGHVRAISPTPDSLSHAYTATISLDATDSRLLIGSAVSVWFYPGSKPDVVRIPATAVFYEGHRPSAWIVRPADSRLELRPITVLKYQLNEALVVDGLQPGEQVVVQDAILAITGERVTPIRRSAADDMGP